MMRGPLASPRQCMMRGPLASPQQCMMRGPLTLLCFDYRHETLIEELSHILSVELHV